MRLGDDLHAPIFAVGEIRALRLGRMAGWLVMPVSALEPQWIPDTAIVHRIDASNDPA